MDKRLVLSICAAAGCLAVLSPSTAAGFRGVLKTETPRRLHRSVKDVVLAVANNQIRSLSDGKYAGGTWDQVRDIQGTSGVVWNYPWGVVLYGLLRASESTDDRAFSDFVVRHDQIAGRFFVYLKWMEATFTPDHQTELAFIFNKTPLSELMKVDRLDYCGAMGAQYLEALLSQNIRASAEDDSILAFVADYIVNRQSRLPDGTFWRPEAGQTLWIDDLYMSCPFLVRWYQHTGDPAHLDDAANQVARMSRLQQDADGLWFHGNFIAEGKTSPYKWGRGNGWAMVATVEVLSAMPENHPSRKTLLDILKRHIHGVLPLQTPSGLWRQVLDHSELWEETSCSAMFAYSIARAVRRGWIGPEYLPFARKAFEGISEKVTENGLVNGTCEGTGIGTTLGFYINRRRPTNDSHGIGPVLLAGSELLLADSIGVPPSGAVPIELGGNFPNPFAGHTRFFYFIRDPGPVQISIYDLRGRRIKTLLDRALDPGTGFMEWDATDDGQRIVPSGTYQIRIEKGSAIRRTKKAVFFSR